MRRQSDVRCVALGCSVPATLHVLEGALTPGQLVRKMPYRGLSACSWEHLESAAKAAAERAALEATWAK